MADTGNKVVTISQAARYLGKDVSGGIGDSVITLRQLKAMRDGSKATPTVLPSGYTELEYIESTGGQYINTRFVPNQSTRLVMDIESESPIPECHVAGARATMNSREFILLIDAELKWRSDYGSNQISLSTAPRSGRILIDKNQRSVTVGGVSATHTIQTFSAQYPMYLLAVNTTGGPNTSAAVKLHSAQIYDNGTLVRDFVPVRRSSDSVVGLFDTVGQKLYTNAGFGSFTAGPVVPHSADPRDGLVVSVSQLARIKIGPTIVSWSTGTDEEIVAMVEAADAGIINLSDYWATEETRTVHLSAMPGSVANANESHAAQDVQMVLTDPGHYTLANGKKCNFVVLQKDCLKEYGAMNSQNTNSGGWDACSRRTWCNSVYYNAVPASLRGIFKQFKVRTATGTGTGSKDSTDWFSLFSEKEIFGFTTYANSSAESKNSQLTWFKTSSNRIKRVNGSATYWLERSPYSGHSNPFCRVTYSGSADWTDAINSSGLAPFGCI